MTLLAVVSLFLFSCGPTTTPEPEKKADDACCTLTEAQEAMFENWKNWETYENQEALVGEMKAYLDACIEKHKECNKDADADAEPNPECAQFKEKWDNFESLTLVEKKELLDQKLEKCCKNKTECPKDTKDETPPAE